MGPVAAFKLVGMVPALPKTRSGKTARKSIADLARAKKVMVSYNIDNFICFKVTPFLSCHYHRRFLQRLKTPVFMVQLR